MAYSFNRPDPQAMQRVLSANPNNTARDVLRLAWLAGLKREEITYLRWEDISMNTHEIILKDRRVAKIKPSFTRHNALETLGIPKASLYRLISDLLDEKKLVKVGMMYYLPRSVVPEEEQYEVICDYLDEHGTATIRDLNFILRNERRQCGRILKKMVEEGKLIRTGNSFSLPLDL